jgi:tetratricopeptide (TPR) repeat protein
MRRSWLILLILALLGGALWLGGPHLWAWYHFRAAQSALERYHSEEALAHLKACLTVWPASAPTHLLACRAARRTGDFEEAKRHLQECRQLEGDLSNESTLEGALLDAAMGDLGKVEVYLEDWAEKHPAQAPLIWEALAEGALRMYRIRDALSYLDLWLRAQPENVQALFVRGNVWRHVRSLGKAAPDYRRVVELDPQRRDARRWLAYCLIEIGQFDEAITHLDVLRRHDPDDPDLLVRLARCRSKLGQMEPARQILSVVLANHPDHGLALRTRGQLALMERKPAEAEDWLRQAVRVRPHDYESHYALFLALVRQGKKTAAKAQSKTTEDLKKRLERLGEIQSREMSMRPHDPALHCELGTLLLRVGYPEVGLGWLHSALNQDSHYRAAHTALADYYAAHGNAEKAAYHRREARTAAPPP